MRKTKIKLMCDGEFINSHSDGGKHYGWSNPIEDIPPIGSLIEYHSFKGDKETGIITTYLVKGHTFTTEEDYNRSFKNLVCKVEVEKIEG